MGGFSPSDVNAYMKSQVPSNAYMSSGFSEMVLLLSLDFSVAYYFADWVGVRPSLLYFFSPKILVYGDTTQSYVLHSLAPQLSVDFAYDAGKLARLFVSPGLAYQAAWFEGYAAHGLGYELALGVDLSFGVARAKGLSLALVFREAKLDVSSGPTKSTGLYSPTPAVNTLDFSSVIFRIGFQWGI